jgi:tetratricopeptide (TPR) repeat protein
MEQSAAYHFKQALRKFRLRDVKGGLIDLEEAIRIDPTQWEYYWTRGAFHYRRRVSTLAEPDLTKAIELCPDVKLVAKVYQRRMLCYRRQDRYNDLIQDATWLIERGYGDRNIYKLRGWARFMLGEKDGAIEDYSRVVDSDRLDFWTLLDRASIYSILGRYSEALEDANNLFAIIDAIPEDYRAFSSDLVHIAHQFRAVIFYNLGEYEKSREDYNLSQKVMELESFSSVEAYVEYMKNNFKFFFSHMPSKPPAVIWKPHRTQEE